METERAVNGARARLAQALGGAADEVYFTSGGTESNNMAVFGTLKPLRGKRRIITSIVEHPSVYETFRLLEGSAETEVVLIGCKKDGSADLDELEQALSDETALVSLMHVNNEVGRSTTLPPSPLS